MNAGRIEIYRNVQLTYMLLFPHAWSAQDSVPTAALSDLDHGACAPNTNSLIFLHTSPT